MENIVHFYKKFYIILIIFTIDILSKFFIIKYLKLYQYKKIFFIINIFYIRNYNLIFNIFNIKYKNYKYLFLILNIILILYLIIKIIYKNFIGYKLILGGTISNIFDRLYHKYIIDFIDINLNNYHIIIFNFADLFILFGIIFILLNFKTNHKNINFKK